MPLPPTFGLRAPDFALPTPDDPAVRFNTLAGRNTILVFPGLPLSPAAADFMAEVAAHRAVFEEGRARLYFILSRPEDVETLGLRSAPAGVGYFMDYQSKTAPLFGLEGGPEDGAADEATVRPALFLLDRNLRFVRAVDFAEARPYLPEIVDELRQLERAREANDSIGLAPVLVIERVFEPALCRKLIDYYEEHGGGDSGFMRDHGGVTVGVIDHGFKRRRDCQIEDQDLRNMAMRRVYNRLVPEIARAFNFQATRMERHIVARYDAETGGFFRPHRDNLTRATTHRRFAVTLNLNAEEYEGGNLRFPEFGDRSYRAPAGGAVVFACGLLHEALPITSGKRYVYLPFLYGEAEAEIRKRNELFLDQRSGGKAKAE
jgi:predicted 2-oxoglutarate/Fe(II)-dependent dioxygenase YbiX